MRGTLLILLALSPWACHGPEDPVAPRVSPLVQPTTPANSPLYVGFPELDQRIVAIDRDTGQVKQTLFPDSWSGEAGRVLDFAVRGSRLYALLINRRGVDERRLFVVDLKTGELTHTVELAPWPQNLTWDCRGRLWVGHATPESGPVGMLSLVEPGGAEGKPTVTHTIALEGAAIGVVPLCPPGTSPCRALVLQRTVREVADDAVVRSSLAEVDPGQGRVVRARQLPPGARTIALGPSGQIYVAHASGPGNLATDGTVSVVNRRTLRVVRRLRLSMVARSMVPTRERLVLNLLAGTGDVWIGVMAPDDRTEFDFRMGEVVGPDLALLDRTLYIPLRRGQAFQRVGLDGRGRPRLRIRGAEDAGPRMGLVRTWMTCDGD